MSKWIVFITVVREEVNFTTDLRPDGERSVATYPLLATTTKEAAELVAARLNHLHGVPEESGADDWQEFLFKADSDLTPQEVAMALDLNDPAFPKNGRHPVWLAEMVNSAKTALTDISRRKAAASRVNEGAYLFVGPATQVAPSSVFHRASSRSNAEALCRLFAKEYSSNGSPTFLLRSVSDLAPEDRLLLDEAIDELAIYDDPDPGVYDPPASKDLLARAEYARRADSWEARLDGADSCASPDPQRVADLVVLLMVARDLLRIGRDYPDAMPDADRQAWLDEVTGYADLMLKQPGFESIAGLSEAPELRQLDVPERFGSLMSLALLSHPAMATPAGTSAEIEVAVGKAMKVCQETASAHVREHMARLANLMVVSCRCPSGTDIPDFSAAARFLQMLHRYWNLASAIVRNQAEAHLRLNPSPLLPLVENLRDRLDSCFSHLTHLAGASDAQESCNRLLAVLTEGDIDELSAVPEWTNGDLQTVERFIARAHLKVGPGVFDLTTAEEFFIRHSEQLILEVDQREKTAWKKVWANAEAQAAASKTSSPQPPPPVPLAEASPMLTPQQRADAIEALLGPMVAVDDKLMSLWARMPSLVIRGKAANTHALTVQVQTQLHKWIDPIVQLLKDAEAASSGVGPLLNGLVSEPLAWEVDTRMAIRSLKDHLVGFIYSNGGETAEALVTGGSCELLARGQRLQAAYEALKAQAGMNPAPQPVNDETAVPKAPRPPLVVLGRPGEPCTVNGKKKRALTDGQHAIVAALIGAGTEGLTKDAIEEERSSAREILKRLRNSDKDWADVIIMAGQTNGRYRIRL